MWRLARVKERRLEARSRRVEGFPPTAAASVTHLRVTNAFPVNEQADTDTLAPPRAKQPA